MITTVFQSIRKHLQDIEYESASGVFIDGEYTEVIASGVVSLAVFPLTFKELRFMPDGAYDFQDRKFYEIGEPSLKKDDVLIYQDDRFRVTQLTDRDFDGGYSAYFGKKEPN